MWINGFFVVVVFFWAGFALAVISHVLCSQFPMFAAKLLTHMMLSCLGTQVTFPSRSHKDYFSFFVSFLFFPSNVYNKAQTVTEG